MLLLLEVLLAGLLAAWSTLTLVKARNRIAWRWAIVAGEQGHVLALVAFLLALRLLTNAVGRDSLGAAMSLLAGGAALGAGVAFLRPAIQSHGRAKVLRAELRRAFPGWTLPGDLPAVVQPARLFWPRRGASAPIQSSVFAHAESAHPLTLDVYGASAGDRRPGIVVIHGGGWDAGERTQFASFNQELAADGYVVAAISYRLAPAHPWPAQREDAMAALRWLKAEASNLGLDPTRLVLFGRSAGGQIATAVAHGAHDPAIKGVIAFYAPHDMPFVWSIAREDDVLNSRRLMLQYLGGPPEGERAELYASASAQHLAHPAAPPTLLVHGTLDELVWVQHSRRLAAHLRSLGVPTVLLELPWGTHAFDYFRWGPGGQLSAAAVHRFVRAVVSRE